MLSVPRLEVKDVTMEFPSVRALAGVSLAFQEAEVHGIVGENGAGKSTLMNILGGVLRPTSGTIVLEGNPIEPGSVRHAQSLGIGMIHQELNLVDELTVAENVFLGREKTKKGLLDRPAMVAETQKFLNRVHATFSPTAKVGDLSIAGKQLVEIARAISLNFRVLIMDEPTAVLSEPESQALYEQIARLKKDGVTVLYISHRLSEVVSICDRISVLRDGAWIATVEATAANPAELANLMVGRPLQDFYPPKPPVPPVDPVLSVNADRWKLFISPGEILGVAGLVGAGRTELAEYIIGIRKTVGAGRPRILMNGREVHIRSPKQAKQIGIAYMSEDRKAIGLLTDLSSVQNVTLANLRAYGKAFLDRRKERAAAERWRKDLDIRVGDLDAPVSSLSGGNQQKLSVAKWLETEPKVLILDEPTRGVDVGARREMYGLIQRLAAQGMACLVISSDLPEIIGLCHRAVVMRDGYVAGELQGDALTEQAVMHLAAGVQAA